MRHYYLNLRVYRPSDQSYWTFTARLDAESLGDVERQLSALEQGLRIAGASKLYLDNVGVDTPMSTGVAIVELDDLKLHEDLKVFLGIKRKRKSNLLQEPEEKTQYPDTGE